MAGYDDFTGAPAPDQGLGGVGALRAYREALAARMGAAQPPGPLAQPALSGGLVPPSPSPFLPAVPQGRGFVPQAPARAGVPGSQAAAPLSLAEAYAASLPPERRRELRQRWQNLSIEERQRRLQQLRDRQQRRQPPR
jgi:hypothetical protein